MSNTEHVKLQIKADIASLEKQLKELRAERKDAIQGNMAFSFGYDPAVAAIEREMALIQVRINAKLDSLEELQPPQAILPIDRIITPTQQKKFNTQLLGPDLRRAMETLDLLEQELKKCGRLCKEVFRSEDVRLKKLQQRFEEAQHKFIQLKNDKRYSLHVTILQDDIDLCYASILSISTEVITLLPLLESERLAQQAEQTQAEISHQEKVYLTPRQTSDESEQIKAPASPPRDMERKTPYRGWEAERLRASALEWHRAEREEYNAKKQRERDLIIERRARLDKQKEEEEKARQERQRLYLEEDLRLREQSAKAKPTSTPSPASSGTGCVLIIFSIGTIVGIIPFAGHVVRLLSILK